MEIKRDVTPEFFEICKSTSTFCPGHRFPFLLLVVKTCISEETKMVQKVLLSILNMTVGGKSAHPILDCRKKK